MAQYKCTEEDFHLFDCEVELLKDARNMMRKLLVNGKDVKTIEYHCPIDFDRLIASVLGSGLCSGRARDRRVSPGTVVR